MPSPPANPPETSGVDVADFMADPVGAIKKIKAEIRAEVRSEIIGAQLLTLCAAYLLLGKD